MSCISLLVALSLHVGLEGDYNDVHPHARCTIDNTIAGVTHVDEMWKKCFGENSKGNVADNFGAK